MELDEVQTKHAVSLCAEIDDWDEFAARAEEYFIAPLCLHHLVRLDIGSCLQRARNSLLPRVRGMAIQTLRHAALQRIFVERYVLPLAAPYAVIKGRALASRYYPDAGLRYARDLDVLVPVNLIPELVMAAQEDGYCVYPERRPLSIDEANVLARDSKVVTLAGPEDILIEVHVQLDKSGFLLDHRAMMQRADTIPIDGLPTRVLTTADHFVYICLHHTKHFWSRLNWVADLDALVNAPDFDEQKVLSEGRVAGVEKTIRACLAFYRACGSVEPIEGLRDDPEGSDLLHACLLILGSGAKREFDMRPDRLSLDFNFGWQFPRRFWLKNRLSRLRSVLRPSTQDYQELRLSRSMYWVYYFLKPALVISRRLRS
jgi:hypothetical protein